jgi:hypothetical protein
MCDYSLHAVANRPAKVGDKLVSTVFSGTVTRGFAAEGDMRTAVCVLPGTELAFERDVEYDGTFFRKAIGNRMARFRAVNLDDAHRHHDALEFPDGQIVLLTVLNPGQRATVLQLPAVASPVRETQTPAPQPSANAGADTPVTQFFGMLIR